MKSWASYFGFRAELARAGLTLLALLAMEEK
jgi:hypothetical protein